MDTKQLTDPAFVQLLVCELDWCILHGDAGPRTTQAIESARAVLAALPSNSARALATCSETLHNAIEQGNPLAAAVAVGLALLARERGFSGPDAAQAPLTDKQIYEIAGRVFTTRVDDSEILEFVRAILAAPVAPAAAALSDTRFTHPGCDVCACPPGVCQSEAAQPDESTAFELPPQVIDQLFQTAGVSTYHPDGDQLDKLHTFARNVVAETIARLPARTAVSQAGGR